MVETVLGNISPITEINLSEKETWVLRTVTFVTTVDAVKVVQCAAFVRSQHVRGRPVWIGINCYTRAPVHLDRPNDRDPSPNYHWECYEGTGRSTDRASLPALRELAVQKGRRAPRPFTCLHTSRADWPGCCSQLEQNKVFPDQVSECSRRLSAQWCRCVSIWLVDV